MTMTMTNIIEILQIVIWPLTVLILVLVAKSPILSPASCNSENWISGC